MARIGFLGTGEIASAMVNTIAADGHAILVSERNEQVSADLERRFAGVTRAANQTVVGDSDIVVVCLLADVARDVLPTLPFRADQTVISVMAGMQVAEVEQLCAPARDLCVAIPLPPMPAGGAPMAVFPQNPTLTAVFGPHATIHPCDGEVALNAHFAATGLLLPLLDQIDVTARWLAAFTGDRGAAEAYLAGLLGGYCTLLSENANLDLATLRGGLSTEGGLNQTLSEVLADSGTHAALEAGLDGFRKRLGLPPEDEQ